MRVYGNWCGPGWTAGQYKDAKDLTDEDRNVPAIDELDAHCKTHDILLHDYPEYADEINQEFVNQVKGIGVTGALFALAVSVAGPPPVYNLQETDNMPRLRNYKYEYPALPEETDAEREDFNRQYMSTEDVNIASNKDYETPDRPIRAKSQKMTRDDKPMSAAKRFPWKELAGLQHTHTQRSFSNMQRDEDVETESTSRSAGTADNPRNIHSGETAIIYAQPTYRLPETHTTILTTTFCGSGVLRDYRALDLILRLNDFKEPLTTLLASRPANLVVNTTPNTTTIGAVYSPGLYNSKIPQWIANASFGTQGTSIGNTAPNNNWVVHDGPNPQRWPVNEMRFPAQLAPNQQPTCKMMTWFLELYQYYTTLGCEYEITINNTQNNHGPGNGDMVVCTVHDSYSLSPAGKTNNRTEQQSHYNDVIYWPNVKKDIIKTPAAQNPQSYYYRIKGSHKPGQGRQMVENDGDEQRWTKFDRTLAADNKKLEELHLMFFPHEFNTMNKRNTQGFAPNGTNTNLEQAVIQIRNSFNFQITMKYIVQFKDLNKNIREPTNNTPTGLSLIYPDVAEANNRENTL